MGKIILGLGARRHTQVLRALGRDGVLVRLSQFSTSSKYHAYADTIQNLKICSHTRVLYQGFTGRKATINAKESLQYGTKIVGGVKPGVEGEHLGLPVLPSVTVAAEKLQPDASVELLRLLRKRSKPNYPWLWQSQSTFQSMICSGCSRCYGHNRGPDWWAPTPQVS
jgi:CoA binding domain